VKQLRETERSLLATYQRYLQTLEEMLNGMSRPTCDEITLNYGFLLAGETVKPKKKQGNKFNLTTQEFGKVSLAAIAAKSFSELLKTHWNFNYRTNIIVAVANSLNSRHDDVQSSRCSALVTRFSTTEAF